MTRCRNCDHEIVLGDFGWSTPEGNSYCEDTGGSHKPTDEDEE